MSYLIGGRGSGYALKFMQDVASRVTNRIQLTIDSRKPCLEAVEGAVNSDIDYTMPIKHYGDVPGAAATALAFAWA